MEYKFSSNRKQTYVLLEMNERLYRFEMKRIQYICFILIGYIHTKFVGE